MAKSKNHSNHNQNYKAHRNGIKKPARVRWISTKGVRAALVLAPPSLAAGSAAPPAAPLSSAAPAQPQPPQRGAGLHWRLLARRAS